MLKTNPEKGLTTRQATDLLKKYGYNEVIHKERFRLLKIFFSQFQSFLIIVLIGAGAVSFMLHETIDAIAIFAIVAINAIIGFTQEYKAENAVAALKKLVIPKAIVIRNGEKKEIPIRLLVPGDIVALEEGDKIPADMELVSGYSLKVDESMLTGESVSVDKITRPSKEPKDKKKHREYKLFKGTVITSGRGRGIVTSTGKHTEFGKIIDLVSKQTKQRSPLTVQLDNLGKKLGIIVLVLVAILFIIGTIREIPLVHMFMTSVALGVSAIPEGLPIIVTLTLAIGVQILARRKAIVRKMNAIETLGATTIICSDKTGTLTLNEMTVKKMYANFQEKEIPGIGYKIKEKVRVTGKENEKLLEICENCNNSSIGKQILGDPTEIALKILTRKAGKAKSYKKLDEKVFTSDRKMMSTLHKVKNEKQIFTKGAFEEVIDRCTKILKNGKVAKLTAKDKKELSKKVEEYSKDALRVLGCAYKPYKNKFEEKGLIFAGLVAMIDPPRKSVKSSIAIAQKAGIKVKIITGDHPITAKAIGEQIGLTSEKIITGQEIDKLSDAKLKKLIYQNNIFARTKPEHKYRIVNILKHSNEVVAVTGDGVNDAPAIKHADVGIAMGIKGTEATKEVADIVLKDDNFTTIVNTIEEGRRIYHNILAFIKFMLSANFDTIMAVGILTILGFPLPILPLQILWINIATDALPALALGQSEAAEDIMEEKPHPKQERIFKKFFSFIFIAVIFQTVANIIIFLYGRSLDQAAGIVTEDLSQASFARTMVFTQIVLFELFFVFVCKDEKHITVKSFLSNKKLIAAVIFSLLLQVFMLYTPFMQTVFKTQALGLKEWALLALFASTAFLVPGLNNMWKKLRRK